MSLTRSHVLGLSLSACAALAVAGVAVRNGAGHDYVQFHAAASLLREGKSPYSVDGQTRVQRILREAEGPRRRDSTDPYEAIGVLPYFYPPWLALACLPLTALAYPVAKAVWVGLGAQCLAASGYGLAELGRRPVSRTMAVALALGLMPCYASVQLGQTPPLVLAALVAAAWLLRSDRDFLAGAALAWAVVKPQLAVVAVPSALLWAARRGRWGVVAGFAATLGALGLVSALIVPDWPFEMLKAPTRVPLPTTLDPSVGVTWLSVLRTLGASGFVLALGVACVAVPAALAAFRAAWDRDRPVTDALALGLIAAFFVAPYSLGYDLAVLVFPLLMLSPRLPVWALALALLGPYWHLAAVNAGARQVGFCAWPAALAWAWWRCRREGSRFKNERRDK